MQATNNIPDPDGLDELLKQAFLDLDMSKAEDSKLMDEVASQVMNKEWPAVAPHAKPWSMGPAVAVSKTWIWILSGVAVLAGLTITALLLGTSKATAKVAETTPEINATTAAAPVKEIKTTQEVLVKAPEQPTATAVHTVADKHLAATTPSDITTAKVANPAPVVAVAPLSASDDQLLVDLKEDEPATLLNPESNKAPRILTADELEKHKKELKILDDSFVSMKMSSFSKINLPLNVMATQGKFLLKKTEVTIKEYKLFLTDLLANGRTKEYEMARPKPENTWKDPKDKNNRAFLEMYFHKVKFENNPVICISTDAMELYCVWLQERMENYFKRTEDKVKVTVRLPQMEEWKYVASEGNKHHVYGTANGKLKDNWLGLGQHWNANFRETQEKFVAVGDSLMIVDDKSTVTHKLNKAGFIGPARAYPASIYDVFNMSGNVSEIVSYLDKKGAQKYRSIGGNWNSTGDYLKINAPDEFNGNTQPSPYIGFRPAIVFETKETGSK